MPNESHERLLSGNLSRHLQAVRGHSGARQMIYHHQKETLAPSLCAHTSPVTGWHGRVPAQRALPHHTFSLLEPGWMGMARIPRGCALLSISPCCGLGRGVVLSSGGAFLCVVGIGLSGAGKQRLCLTSLTCKLRQTWRKNSLFQPLPNSVAVFQACSNS